jgi:hypothetical protein
MDALANRWTQLTIAQICLLLWLVLMGPLFWLLNPRLGAELGIGVVLLWLAIGVSIGVFVHLWQCPRCGKPFNHGNFDYLTPYRRKCYQCGLPRGTAKINPLAGETQTLQLPPRRR